MHFRVCETEIIRNRTRRMDRLAPEADMERHNALATTAVLSGPDCEYSASVAGFLGLTPGFDRHKRDTAWRGDMAWKPL